MNTGVDGKACYCDHGWVPHQIPGPVIDGEQTIQLAYSRCPACQPDLAARIAVGLPRDDDAIRRHRARQDRRAGRTTEEHR